MTFTHDTGSFNVEATLVSWLFGQLIANKPDTVATVRLAREFPEQAVQCPMWSAHFVNVDSEGGEYHGGRVGGTQRGRMMFGIMEVGCWVSRREPNWRGQKAQMTDAVTKALNNLYASGAAIIIKDFYTNAATPADTTYKVLIRSWALRPPPVDPNPALERERVLVYYQWVERV